MTLSPKKMSRRHRMRGLAYAPLVAAVAAGAICTGAGTGAAATTAGSANLQEWRVHNNTGQVLTDGLFAKFEGDHTSTLSVAGLQPGEFWSSDYEPGSAFQLNYTVATDICYLHTQWRMDQVRTPGQKWRDVYVFVDAPSGKLFVTPEGAPYNTDLLRTGSC
ncbi:hypothetical protein [Rhodococcus jostii]|uniref:hypothetical protein n=1 Tax=Rhodococcus jostii TaxID=132919 RepID=UPI00362F6AAF